jgi:hypothetical protein
MTKYEVVEYAKNTWNEDGSAVAHDKWVCDNESDLILQWRVRQIEAEMLGRSDSYFEALEDGESVNYSEHYMPDDDAVYAALKEMGYADAEISTVMELEETTAQNAQEES